MAPQTAKSLMKEFRASFRRKKVVVDSASKAFIAKEAEDHELEKLVELKENLDKKFLSTYNDAELLGFLRARSLNVKEAEKLVKLDENVNKILCIPSFDPSEDVLKYSFSGIIGCDKEGSLVKIINVGGADVRGLMHVISTIDGLRILYWMVRKDKKLQEEFNKKTGKKAKQFVYIINLEDLSMSLITYKPVFDTAMQALKLLQDHFHDVLKSVLFINTPSFFSTAYKLFKPAIGDSLQQRIKILDQENFREDLLKIIDADVLPKHFGGERVDSNGDPKCTEFHIPESCYASNFLREDDPDVVVATVPAGATLNFRYPVRHMGSTLSWYIQIKLYAPVFTLHCQAPYIELEESIVREDIREAKDNDIGIGVYTEPFPSGSETPRTRKKKEEDMSKMEQLTPIIRSQCHVCPEVGSTVLWFTGNVVLHFDNNYSWMNSKEVLFKIGITPPSDSKSH